MCQKYIGRNVQGLGNGQQAAAEHIQFNNIMENELEWKETGIACT